MKKILSTIICCVFTFSVVFAQQYGAFGELLENDRPYAPEVVTSSKENFKNTINYLNFNKGEEQTIEKNRGLPQGLNYKIELTHSKYPLDLYHRIFKLYKKVSFSQTPSLGFTYYTGSFVSEIDALEYLERSVLTEFPKAKIVKERKYLK